MEKARISRLSSIRYPFFCAKLFSARSVSAIITTATERLIVITSTKGIVERCGTLQRGSPGSTADNVAIPHCCICVFLKRNAPAAIKTTAIGNLGITFFATNKMISAATPIPRDARFTSGSASHKCRSNSGNSPIPAEPPNNFGSCIKIIVVQIPVINPPITGAEI